MLKSRETTYLDQLVEVASFIPSMLTTESAKMLYALCYMQRLEGHVVEVGSWQGYSTSFLARAVKDSKNGSLYAIDHFKGNIGKEHFYTIGSQDLSDLRKGFEANLIKVGLFDYVNLLAMSNDQAAKELEGKKIRFLFIDGDHTKEGVEKDVSLFFPLLVPGSIVVFDDFRHEAPGLVEALDALLKNRYFERVFAYRNTLVVMT